MPTPCYEGERLDACISRLTALHEDMFSRLPQAALEKCARKLGMPRREKLGRNAPFEPAVLKDYAVWGLALAGTTVARRYASAPALAPDTLDPVLLPAMAEADFSLYSVEATLDIHQVRVVDLLTDRSEKVDSRLTICPRMPSGMVVAGWGVRVSDTLVWGAGSLPMTPRQREVLTTMLSGPYPRVTGGLGELRASAANDPGRLAAFVTKSVLDARLYTLNSASE